MHDLLQVQLRGQIITQPGLVLDAKETMLRRTAQVRIHDQRCISSLGKRVGEVDEGRGLSFTGPAADNRDRVGIRGLAVKLNVRPHDPVGFGIRIVVGIIDKHRNIFGDNRQNRNLEKRLHVLHGFDAGIEVFDKKRKAHAKHRADEHAQQDVEHDTGPGWCARGFCAFPDDRRVLRHLALHRLRGESHNSRLENVFCLDIIILGFQIPGREGFGFFLSILRLGAPVFQFLERGFRDFQVGFQACPQ